MKRILTVVLLCASSIASAHNCPNEMKSIDAKLGASPALSGENKEKVKALRIEGEKFHKEGKHKESMESLQAAKKILGI